MYYPTSFKPLTLNIFLKYQAQPTLFLLIILKRWDSPHAFLYLCKYSVFPITTLRITIKHIVVQTRLLALLALLALLKDICYYMYMYIQAYCI